MATQPREHVEEIRRTKFSIGGEENPLTEDLHQAVKNLSAELYAKDVHFLMELIQNAEDNEYPEGVNPSLEFVITSRDITGTGAPATLLVFNNERGFSPKNIESICSVGRSTKKGLRKRGYIGEKGIGFKSVFLITAQPCIFSNGYQIRFNEEPCSHCNVGYIVPEWVDENPSLSVIKKIYGSESTLPTTTIVLPLKADKVKPVKQQLSSIHPEVLLFLSKIRRLSVKEDNIDSKLNTMSSISISSEVNFVRRKNIDAESYLLDLSSDEAGDKFERECSYYMWKQKFPVRQENKVERRMEVEEWVLTLAFPNGERLNRGMNSPGVYAFLPTEMVTNFPFIIQADFLLASSRETILLDNKWNQGIIDCVASAFINAFISLVKTTGDAPVSSLPRMFEFLPVNASPYPNFEAVREAIRVKLVDKNIVPCESYTEQKLFRKPCEVGRLMPAFWNILGKAREQGVNLHNISSHGRYVLSSSFDKEQFNHILNFLEVEPVDDEWYAKCIRSSNLLLGLSEDVYLKLLLFLAVKWTSNFQKTSIKDIPLLKFVGGDGDVSFCSINELQLNSKRVFLSSDASHISWLIDWNREFRCAANCFFAPKSTQLEIQSCSDRQKILEWLSVKAVSVNGYAIILNDSLNGDRKLVVKYAHFLHHSFSNNYLTAQEVYHLCSIMPLVDNYGRVNTQRSGVLVPANGSNWVGLMGSNPWIDEGYVELAEDYLHSDSFAGVKTPANQLISFLKGHLGASDVPHLSPPNAAIPTVSAPLTKKNAFLLLDWIRNLNRKGVQLPNRFLICIKNGSWLKISLGDSPGYRPPSQSFLLSSSWGDLLQIGSVLVNIPVIDQSWGDLLQIGSVLVDIPVIDQTFYGSEINGYKKELRTIGVMFEYREACAFMGKRLMSLAASSTLTRTNVYSILQFIRYLREKLLSPGDFIRSIKDGRWLRTYRGDKSPVESVLYDEDWKAASQISDIPFIDKDYYGKEICSYETELQLLGVVVGFNKNYQLVDDYLKSSPCFSAPSAEIALLVFECVRNLRSPDKLVRALQDQKFLKTNMGYKSPRKSYLCNPEWGCLLRVFNSFPLIDDNFYGSKILLYKNELKQLGAIVDFEEATKAFALVFKQQASLSSIRKDNVISFLACCKDLMKSGFKFPSDLKKCIREEKWLRTRLADYRAPKECILFGPKWDSISSISLLPFIDDSDNYYGKAIHEYKNELNSMGVVFALRNGSKFLTTGLYLPQNPGSITPANVYALLECIQNVQLDQNGSLPEAFLKKVSKKWLKTTDGYYRPPDKCLLFNSEWGSFLQREDGPFIDEAFYGSNITSYEKELSAVGVIVDVKYGCSLLASHLDFHSKFSTIVRISKYLNEFKWEPTTGDTKKIWIPNGSENGDWVSPEDCVLHDKDGLFGMQFYVLDKHYEQSLLSFFSNVLAVQSNPSLDDYIELWKIWEKSGHHLSLSECCSYWGYVLRHWSSKTEKTLTENLTKLPVFSGPDGILLLDKSDVFIADDLQLKDLFGQSSSSHSLFVWYPQPSLPSLPRTKLLEIYSKIGVRTISESVEKEMFVLDGAELKEVDPEEISIGSGLFRLVLGFLADFLKMEAQKRHEAMKHLLNVTVYETAKPITVGYSLPLSSGEILNVEASRMVQWERDDSKFYTQKIDRSSGHECILEYATYFSEVISEGVLWENEDHIRQLAELIKLGFVLEFDEAAIGFLLKSKNLQIYLEDEELLSSAIPSI